VADLGIHRIGADLVADRAAMAARSITWDERIVVDRGVVGAETVYREHAHVWIVANFRSSPGSTAVEVW
jgi:hypothetical protein